MILIATGSEVELAMQAADVLSKEEVRVRVVSMPSTDVFDAQDVAYRESVASKVKRRVAIEAGVSAGWLKYVGLDGCVVGLDRFGESAPAEVAFEYFGFNVENITAKVRALL